MVAALAAVAVGGLWPSAGRAAEPDPQDVAVAERLSSLVPTILQYGRETEVSQKSGRPSPASLRQAAALAEAAGRLDPTDPAYPRTLADLRLQEGDAAGTIAALQSLRQIQPDNQVAGIQTIDLQAGTYETAEKRQGYLRAVLDAGGLPAPVRSHAAVLLSRVLFERGLDKESEIALDEAVKLNPVNPTALQMKYERLTARGAAPAEVVDALLHLLRSNPMQPEVMATLADRLAAAGLPRQSAEWYERSFAAGKALGIATTPNDVVLWSAQQLALGQARTAATALPAVYQQFPDNLDARFVRLLAVRAAGDRPTFEAELGELRAMLAERINALSASANGRPPAPAGAALPDVSADANALAKHLNDPAARRVADAYSAALIDLAWADVYFAEKPAPPAVLDALGSLLGEASGAVARLRGWSFKADGRTGEARVKLAAVADRDPLAKMGLLQLDAKDGRDVKAAAAELVNADRTGLLGALLFEGLKNLGATVQPGKSAEALSDAVGQFPKPLIDAVDRPDTVRDLYAINVERDAVVHAYGEPFYVTVTLRNTMEEPISIGQGGFLRPELAVDVTAKGLSSQTFPATALASLRRSVVLMPRQQVSQRVRVDQGPFRQYLTSLPQVSIPVYTSVLTNPVLVKGPDGSTKPSPGPLGYRGQASVMEREANPLQEKGGPPGQAAVRALDQGNSAGAIRAAELIGGYIGLLGRQEKAGDAEKQVIATFADKLRVATTNSPSPAVRGYSAFVLVNLLGGQEKVGQIKELLGAKDWRQRLLGAITAGFLPPEVGKPMLSPLAEGDSDAGVKEYAAAALARLGEKPAEKPATQPASPPAQ